MFWSASGTSSPAGPGGGPSTPALLVPGLCGSVLHVRELGEAGEGVRRWIVGEYADSAYHTLWGEYHPEDRSLRSLRDDEVVIPTGRLQDGGLYACDVLDPSFGLMPPAALRYYHSLIQEMKQWGYTPGSTLHGFAYDFRQSNLTHLEGLLVKLQAVSSAYGGAKVDVITHSMGGIVFKAFLARFPQEFSQLVRSWVAVAAPFNGAPGFSADALLTGVQFVPGWASYFFVQRETMRQMVCQAPSVFELLPSPGFSWGEGVPEPAVTLWLKGKQQEHAAVLNASAEGNEDVCVPKEASVGLEASDSGEKVEAHAKHWRIGGTGLRPLLKACMEGNCVEVDGSTIDLPFKEDIMEHADETRQLLSSATLPEGCVMLNIYGVGLDTPFGITYGSEESPLSAISCLADGTAQAAFSMVEGDGTVPASSAAADGLFAVQRVGLPGDHRELLESPATFELIKSFLQDVAKPQQPRGAGDCSAGTAGIPTPTATEETTRHFYASYKYWQYCSEQDDLPEVDNGWVLV